MKLDTMFFNPFTDRRWNNETELEQLTKQVKEIFDKQEYTIVYENNSGHVFELLINTNSERLRSEFLSLDQPWQWTPERSGKVAVSSIPFENFGSGSGKIEVLFHKELVLSISMDSTGSDPKTGYYQFHDVTNAANIVKKVFNQAPTKLREHKTVPGDLSHATNIYVPNLQEAKEAYKWEIGYVVQVGPIKDLQIVGGNCLRGWSMKKLEERYYYVPSEDFPDGTKHYLKAGLWKKDGLVTARVCKTRPR